MPKKEAKKNKKKTLIFSQKFRQMNEREMVLQSGYLGGLRSSLGGWTQKVKSWYWGRPLVSVLERPNPPPQHTKSMRSQIDIFRGDTLINLIFVIY